MQRAANLSLECFLLQVTQIELDQTISGVPPSPRRKVTVQGPDKQKRVRTFASQIWLPALC